MASTDPQVCFPQSSAAGLCQRRQNTDSRRRTEDERGAMSIFYLLFFLEGRGLGGVASIMTWPFPLSLRVLTKEKLTWRVHEAAGR